MGERSIQDALRQAALQIGPADIFGMRDPHAFPIAYVDDAEYRRNLGMCQVALVGCVLQGEDYELWQVEELPKPVTFHFPHDGFSLRPPGFLGGIGSSGFVSSVDSHPCDQDTCGELIGGIVCPKGQASGLISFKASFELHRDSVVPFLYDQNEEDKLVAEGGGDLEFIRNTKLDLSAPYPVEIYGKNGAGAYGIFSIDNFESLSLKASGQILVAYGRNWSPSGRRFDLCRYGRLLGHAEVVKLGGL